MVCEPGFNFILKYNYLKNLKYTHNCYNRRNNRKDQWTKALQMVALLQQEAVDRDDCRGRNRFDAFLENTY